MRPISLLAAAAAIVLLPTSAALAQRQPPTPEQRIQRQIDELQRRVFPKGRPADTAGFADDPAATQSSVMTLDQRLDALERQIADMLRQSEDNGNRLRSLETSVGQLKSDEDQRIQTLEQRVSAEEAAVTAAPAAAPAPADTTPPAKPRARSSSRPPKTAAATPPAAASDEGVATAAASDPGEDAYSQGFRQWQGGDYDGAIGTLRAFVKAYPKHRRVSYANNLIGRAQLDKGDAQSAAATLLANYRANPGGDRAADSLFYLGQALMKLGQPGQACKAYGELDAVYGAKVRPDLKKLESDAKAQANCG
jgi:TolA-binding protein